MRYPTLVLASILALLLSATWLAASAESDKYPFLQLPERAFLIQGGAVSVRAGVTNNWKVESSRSRGITEAFPYGKVQYPTRYFVLVGNETNVPVFFHMECTLPKKKPFTCDSRAATMPNNFTTCSWEAFDVVEEEPIPLKISVYADENRSTLLGSEATSLYFEASDRQAIRDAFKNGRDVPIIPGWKEMRHPLTMLAGTAADRELLKDVQYLLWKEESKLFRDCEHQVLEARGDPPDQSAHVSRYSEELRRRITQLQVKGLVRTEVWRVKSCESVAEYELWMFASPEAGMDILAVKTDLAPSPLIEKALSRSEKRISSESPAPPLAASAGGKVDPAESEAGSEFVLFDHLKDQFTLEVPRGWFVTDQAAMMGHAGPEGIVVFVAVEMQAQAALPTNASRQDTEAIVQQLMKSQERVDSGEIPSFFVDRYRALPGMSCAGIDEKAKQRLLKALTGPALGKKAEILQAPEVEPAALGGCQGLQVMVKAKDATGKEVWMLVRTVSDGTTGYDFTLRNYKEYFEKNRPTFERVLASIKLAKSFP